MKKVIILLAMIIILAGCTGFQFRTKETIKIPSIREGTQGIEVEYLAEMPPYEIFEGQMFEIGFELQNKGAEDVRNGLYTIGSNEQYIIMLDEKMNRFNVKGKSVYAPLGEQQRISIKAQANKLGGQLIKQSTTIIVNACYSYLTSATILECIDTQPLKKEKKVCTIQTIGSSGGQGGPVAVTGVEPKTMPHADTSRIVPGYVIQVANLGTGQVIDPQLVYDACMGRSIGKDNYDMVRVSAMLSNDVLNCEPSLIRLREADNKVFCKLNSGISRNAGNYQAPLTIDLEYGYMQTKPKTIRIFKSDLQYY